MDILEYKLRLPKVPDIPCDDERCAPRHSQFHQVIVRFVPGLRPGKQGSALKPEKRVHFLMENPKDKNTLLPDAIKDGVPLMVISPDIRLDMCVIPAKTWLF